MAPSRRSPNFHFSAGFLGFGLMVASLVRISGLGVAQAVESDSSGSKVWCLANSLEELVDSRSEVPSRLRSVSFTRAEPRAAPRAEPRAEPRASVSAASATWLRPRQSAKDVATELLKKHDLWLEQNSLAAVLEHFRSARPELVKEFHEHLLQVRPRDARAILQTLLDNWKMPPGRFMRNPGSLLAQTLSQGKVRQAEWLEVGKANESAQSVFRYLTSRGRIPPQDGGQELIETLPQISPELRGEVLIRLERMEADLAEDFLKDLSANARREGPVQAGSSPAWIEALLEKHGRDLDPRLRALARDPLGDPGIQEMVTLHFESVIREQLEREGRSAGPAELARLFAEKKASWLQGLSGIKENTLGEALGQAKTWPPTYQKRLLELTLAHLGNNSRRDLIEGELRSLMAVPKATKTFDDLVARRVPRGAADANGLAEAAANFLNDASHYSDEALAHSGERQSSLVLKAIDLLEVSSKPDVRLSGILRRIENEGTPEQVEASRIAQLMRGIAPQSVDSILIDIERGSPITLMKVVNAHMRGGVMKTLAEGSAKVVKKIRLQAFSGGPSDQLLAKLVLGKLGEGQVQLGALKFVHDFGVTGPLLNQALRKLGESRETPEAAQIARWILRKSKTRAPEKK